MRKKQYLCIEKEGKRAPPETGPEKRDAKMTPCKVITINCDTQESKVTSWHESRTDAEKQIRFNKARAISEGSWKSWIIKPQ